MWDESLSDTSDGPLYRIGSLQCIMKIPNKQLFNYTYGKDNSLNCMLQSAKNEL